MAKQTMVKRETTTVSLRHEATATLPNGKVLENGDLLTVRGEPGAKFKFRYARHDGAEITCFGGRPGHEQWRAFRPEQIRTAKANPRVAAIKDDIAALYDGLTPGQKAALTKRLKAAA